MRYEEVNVIQRIDTGKEDGLGNAIYEDIKRPALARPTEWTANDVEVYGRSITTGGRKMLFKPMASPITTDNQIEIEGKAYSVVSVTDLHRWIMIIIKGYRL